MNYQFTNSWFDLTAKANFSLLLPELAPCERILEIGSYEGRATTWMGEHLPVKHLVCVDTWRGGAEHDPKEMIGVFQRFSQNIEILKKVRPVEVSILVGNSSSMLADMIATGEPKFDFVYIDGSHRADDVLTDAVMAFQLVRSGGIMAFDDYVWTEKPVQEMNPLDNPRIAVDCFFNVFRRHLSVMVCNPSQLWLTKR